MQAGLVRKEVIQKHGNERSNISNISLTELGEEKGKSKNSCQRFLFKANLR